jgi:hypothetical protein
MSIRRKSKLISITGKVIGVKICVSTIHNKTEEEEQRLRGYGSQNDKINTPREDRSADLPHSISRAACTRHTPLIS